MADAPLAAILDASPDAIVCVDEAGQVTLFNRAASSIFGISEARAAGQSLAALMPGMDATALAARMQDAVHVGGRNRIARFEHEGLRNGGETAFPVEVSLSEPGAGGGRTRWILFVRDITEKRAAEEELRLFRLVADASSHGVVISSMTWAGEPIVYVNPAFSRMTGYTLSDVLGMNGDLLLGEDRDQEAVALMRAAIAEGREVTVVLRNYRQDGTPFWNELSIAPVRDDRGRLTHYVGVHNDVTERLDALERLRQHGRQLDAIFNLSPDGFVLFDTERRLAYVNPAFDEISGLSRAQLPEGMTLAAFEAVMAARADASQAYVPVPEADSTEPDLLVLSGEPRRTLARDARTDARGELMLHFRDVTRESEVDRLKSEFLATAAHELRTPMVSIFGFTELLLHRSFNTERTRSMMETIHKQAGVMVKLINELLDLARIEARRGRDFEITVLRVGELLEETAQAVLMADDPRRPVLRLGEGDPLLRADRDKLQLAVTNLLSNAYKYSPGGGEIELSLLRAWDGGTPLVGIRVSDHGIGMTREQAARAFERFYRADPSCNIPGTGLGLPLVKEIVELHGGRVELETEPGRGTRATLWLREFVSDTV